VSAYACPGCGLDAPLTQACPRCEGESICHGDLLKACQGLLLRLQATREELCSVAEPLGQSGKVVKNYGWQLANIIALPTPVPCKGAQGLWPLPPDVLGQVRRQIEIANGVEVQRGQ